MASAADQRWAAIVRILTKLKAHPEQEDSLRMPLAVEISAGAQELVPLSTWNTLLQQQVPLEVLTECSDLLPTCPTSALAAAEVLLGRALDTLTLSPSSSSSSGGGGSSSTLTQLLWGQLEQSGMLQQLPGLLSSNITAMQAVMTAGGDCPTDQVSLARSTAVLLLQMLQGCAQLQPNFFPVCAVGQQCMLPAMQLSLLLLQYASKALPHEGRNELLKTCVGAAWTGVNAGISAAVLLGAPGLAGQAADGSSRQQVAKALLSAGETLQCCCLGLVVWMLVSFMQEAPGSSTGGGSSSTSGGGSSSTSGSSSGTGTVLPPHSGRAGAGVAGRSPSSQQLAAGVSGGEWRPAALAPSMPAVYATMLQRLGLSREMGLWLAEIMEPVAAADAAGVLGFVRTGLEQCCKLQAGKDTHKVWFPQQTAPLQTLVPAITLQWLASLPDAQVLQLGWRFVSLCALPMEICRDAQLFVEMHRCLLVEDAAGDLTVSQAAYQDTVVLSAALLDKLLGMRHALPNTASSSSSHNSAPSSSSSSSSPQLSDHDMLLLACELVVELLASGLKVCAQEGVMVRLSTAATSGDEGGQGQESSSSNNSLPVTCAQLCKLLQEFLRLEVAAAAAAIPESRRQASTWMVEASRNFQLIFHDIHKNNPARAMGGPLVAPVVAAADASSPDALQLFGLLCSLLKAFNIITSSDSSGSNILVQSFGAPGNGAELAALIPLVSSAVLLMLKPALMNGTGTTNIIMAAAAWTLGSSTNNNSDGSSCAAALLWLMLLGRCCLATALLLKCWQHILETDGCADNSSRSTWWMHRRELVESLKDHLLPGINVTTLWLVSAANKQQLGALGYQPQDLLQQLARTGETLTAALKDLPALDPSTANPWDARRAAAVLAAIQQPLQAAGSLLTCFATRQVCNNPGCTNMSGPSEARLVRGHGCTCSGCRAARYCGRDPCQLAHWKQHKPVCKALAAAAAAAAGGAAEAAAKSGNGGAAV